MKLSSRVISLGQGVVTRYGSILFLLALWAVITEFGLVSEEIIPSCSQVFRYLYQSTVSGTIFPHITASLGRSLSGFLTSLIFGVPLAILMARVSFFDRFANPLMAITYPVPKIALLPLFILWLGIGFTSKFCLVVLGCIYPIIMNTYQGVKMVDKIWIWSARSMGVTGWRLIPKVVFPAILPYIFVGARISLAISFLILFGAEMIGTRSGLGALIINAMEEHRPDIIFASVLCIAGLGFFSDRALRVVRSRLLKWRKEESIFV
jgi:ABC-type nitrate/sulfonate/bicarbonate transport system permease component